MIKLYWAVEDGAEFLDDEADFEITNLGDFDAIEDAVSSVDFRGRGFLWDTERLRYTRKIYSGDRGIEVSDI